MPHSSNSFLYELRNPNSTNPPLLNASLTASSGGYPTIVVSSFGTAASGKYVTALLYNDALTARAGSTMKSLSAGSYYVAITGTTATMSAVSADWGCLFRVNNSHVGAQMALEYSDGSTTLFTVATAGGPTTTNVQFLTARDFASVSPRSRFLTQKYGV